MFNKKKNKCLEVDLNTLKNLKLFERFEVEEPDCNGLSIYYIRVIGGFIRCASNNEAISQIFIPFTNNINQFL